jgi:hypothetical protein
MKRFLITFSTSLAYLHTHDWPKSFMPTHNPYLRIMSSLELYSLLNLACSVIRKSLFFHSLLCSSCEALKTPLYSQLSISLNRVLRTHFETLNTHSQLSPSFSFHFTSLYTSSARFICQNSLKPESMRELQTCKNTHFRRLDIMSMSSVCPHISFFQQIR